MRQLTVDDEPILSRFFHTRDEAAFAELLRRHGPMVWAVCRHSLAADADAEDAFQATFLALIRSAGAVRRGSDLAAWLHGVAVRVATKVKRSAVRRRQREERVAGSEADCPVPEATWDALLAAVHEEVNRLPDSLRTAFMMCELEGVRQTEAAARLGWKAGTLTGRLKWGGRDAEEMSFALPWARVVRLTQNDTTGYAAIVQGGSTIPDPLRTRLFLDSFVFDKE